MLRTRLQRALALTAASQSMRIVAEYSATGQGSRTPRPFGCVNESYALGLPGLGDDRLEVIGGRGGCSQTEPLGEVVVVGDRIWASSTPDRWRAGRISPVQVAGYRFEQLAFWRLFARARDITVKPRGGAYETASGRFAAGPLYAFTDPASAISSVRGGPATVHATATLDARERLRELVIDAGPSAAEAQVDEKYEQLGGPQRIAAPARRHVHGSIAQLPTGADLRAFLAEATGCTPPSPGAPERCGAAG